mmetsp:Transcript_44314/g.78330  ORF Transcript_44314/g.78330 Transcript_44314/m.78330 type:complete len:366 (+) Transcript_44314:5222-6319(+)
MNRHGRQHLSHDAVAARVAQQMALQRLQHLRHDLEGRAVAQCPGLALHQRDVVLPVVEGQVALEAAGVPGHLDAVCHQHQGVGVGAQAEHGVHVPCWHAVAVALEVHQRRGGDAHGLLDVAVEGLRARHQPRLLILQHVSHCQCRPLGVRGLGPAGAAALGEPGIERGQVWPAPFARFAPDLAPAVLHVLLDDALLPAGGRVAELGLEQVMRAHGLEARVDRALLADADLVDRGLHVVVHAPLGDAAQRLEGACVGVEQHLVALTGIRHEPEGPTGAQLHVRQLHPVVDAADHQTFLAPVELEGLAPLEGQRHEGGRYRLTLPQPPRADEVGQPAVAAAVAHGLQFGEQSLGGAPLGLGAPRVGS